MEQTAANDPLKPPSSSASAPLPPPPPRRKKRGRIIVIIVVLLLLIGAAVWYYLRFIAPYESTDDAFLEGYVTYIAPRVSGPVTVLAVNDNQWVNAGDVLIEIDPRDFQTDAAQAEANLAAASNRVAQAEAQIAVDQAKVEQQQAAVVAAEAVAARSQTDLERYAAVPTQAISRIQYDLAKTQATSAAADLKVAQQAVKAAQALLPLDAAVVETARTEAQVARTRVEYAQLELSYTKVVAPRNGWVTHRTVERGAYVQTGQALLALVPDDIWVVANFKETQLTHMQPGQPVSIHIDAYPQHDFEAKVDSLQSGSGARFSLLPPENAVGNYVKVVQRVPVKIVFAQRFNGTNMNLAPGLSVEAKVRVK